ncbi:MAG: NYN domain-containing protein [Planctomycetaceae bacterium]
MPESFLVIDGYNLLHAAGMARKKYADGQLQNARRRLLIYLAAHLTEAERERTTVVFDAGDAPSGVARQMIVESMSVEFAPPGGDADSLIEQILQSHSAPRSVRVVSSDHRLQKAARRRRAAFVDSDRFVEELDHRGPAADPSAREPAGDIASNPKFDGTLSEDETEKWLKLFGEIPEAEQLRDETEQWDAWTEELRKELEREMDAEKRRKRPGKP